MKKLILLVILFHLHLIAEDKIVEDFSLAPKYQ